MFAILVSLEMGLLAVSASIHIIMLFSCLNVIFTFWKVPVTDFALVCLYLHTYCS